MPLATCLSLALAQLGNGRFQNVEYWRDAHFPENPDEFIAMAKALELPKVQTFEDACQAFVDALIAKKSRKFPVVPVN
jgi:hypothetical protein